jgi:general secretion pathway protein B
MSFILDALRKSEIERQRQSGPTVAEFPVAREDRRLPIALIAIGVLLALNVAVVLFFLLRREPEREAAPPAQAAAAAPVSVSSPASVAPAPPRAGAAGDAYAQEGADPYADVPAELYGEPATLPPDAPDPTLLPPSQAAAPPTVAFTPSPTVEDAASVLASTGLPPLTVDLHIFTDDPAKRAVFINGRRYIQGAQIAEGPVVEQITRDGAVLSYRGRRFTLPRL